VSETIQSPESERELRSEFLNKCASYLGQAHGAGAMLGIAGKYQESLNIPWFPELNYGMPAFDSRSWTWDFRVARDGDHNTATDINELVGHHWGYGSCSRRLSWLWFGEDERAKLHAFEEAAKLAKN